MKRKYNPYNCDFVATFEKYELYTHRETGNTIKVPFNKSRKTEVFGIPSPRDWANSEIVK